MKKITLLILLLTAIIGTAQDIKIVKSDIFQDSKKISSLNYSLEDGNGGLVTIRSFYGGFGNKLRGYYIQHFDADLNLINQTEFEVKKNQIKNAFIKDNKLHLIEYVVNKKDKEIIFNAVSANLSDLSFSSKKILSLSESNQKKYFGIIIFPLVIDNLSQKDDNHTGEVVMSRDNNYFAINFDINNKNKETHKIFVFDSDFNKTYEQTIQKDIKDKYFYYNSIDIDDTDGTVYFLGKSFENNTTKSKKNGKTNYHFEVYKVNASGQANVSFKNDDKFISSLKLKKSNDRLVCIGFYGQKKEYKINGVSLFNLDPETLAIQNKKFTPFSKQFLTDKYGNKEAIKKRVKKKGLNNIDFKSVTLMDNGDIAVNAEEYYITIHTINLPNGGTTERRLYHYDDIISLRLTETGDLKWARNINKRQTGPANSSYTSITIGEDSYFFINCSDNIKKLSADRILFKQTKAKRSNLYVIKINKEGEFNFKKLIDDKASKVYYRVLNGNINIDKQTVVLMGKRKKKSRILKLKI